MLIDQSNQPRNPASKFSPRDENVVMQRKATEIPLINSAQHFERRWNWPQQLLVIPGRLIG